MGPKLALDLTSGNGEILNEIVKIFQRLGENGLDTLTPVAVYLWGVLFAIELVTDWTLYEGNLRLSKIINDIVKGSFFLFIINSWSFFVGAIENFFYSDWYAWRRGERQAYAGTQRYLEQRV